MLESICVTEKLHWPKKELSKKSILNVEENQALESEGLRSKMSLSVLRDIFTTGTSSYNVLLHTKEKQHLHKQSKPGPNKKRRKTSKASNVQHNKDSRKNRAAFPSSASLFPKRKIQSSTHNAKAGCNKNTESISVSGNHIILTHKTKNKSKKMHCLPNLAQEIEPHPPKPQIKEDLSIKKCYILNAIKPSNVEKEKLRFFKTTFTYNPQFKYANSALPNVLAKHSHASDRFLQQAINIMKMALQKYGNYEKFEQATGGRLLPKTRIWHEVRKYMEKEGCLGEVVVHLSEDLLSRASMTALNGRPTLNINISTARELWIEGMLRHEIGTHYFRGLNNSQQPWNNKSGRKKYGLKPANPTEEGLASIHSVLFRQEPFLWRAALLYYTVYQASHMSFTELFKDVGQFVKDPNTRWDYCVRAKRGLTDTSQPGCFSKDQVYLDGILHILRHRKTIDFRLLIAMGKVTEGAGHQDHGPNIFMTHSETLFLQIQRCGIRDLQLSLDCSWVSYEDLDRLKDIAVLENMRIPQFLQNRNRYMDYLEKIMTVNGLSDTELAMLID